MNYIKIFLRSYFLLYTCYQVVHALNEIMFNSSEQDEEHLMRLQYLKMRSILLLA